MESAVPFRLTAREGRAFAATVGGACLVLAGVARWRGHGAVAAGLGAGAVLLLAAGLVAPRSLGPVRRGWMALARALSRVTTPVFMALVYFGVLTPFGIVRRTVGGNPLRRDAREGSYWHTRPAGRRRSRLHRQF